MNHDSQNLAEPKLGRTLIEDLRSGDLRPVLRREWNEMKAFYLDQERNTRLLGMGRIKRFFVTSWWLVKSLFFKLTPVRRILLVISFLLVFFSRSIVFNEGQLTINNDSHALGFIVLLFILMLELKDKLLVQGELAAGRAVQRAVMPKRQPVLSGWEIWLMTKPANEVSGDFVDYLELGEGRFGLALGDVAGKGLKAALLMMKIQATLRAIAADYSSLSALGAKLNTILRRDGLPDCFASLVYLELQPDAGALRVLNAGHMPPVRLQGTQLTEVPHYAVALGLRQEATFTEQLLQLEMGEVLVIYSDGVTEARNDRGEFFGEARLFAFLPTLVGLPAHEIGARIVMEVEGFVNGARAHDDLSLVVLKRVPGSVTHPA